jgi:phosphoribosylaminoimidazolecarboxamide formyltransferase/IMP cyclohydrolase
MLPIRRALISVYDKAGLDKLASALKAAGIIAVSTGGTARALKEFGVSVEDVSSITGFPEVLDGRVKTLHPNIFAGILARGDRGDDLKVLAKHGIDRFELIVVNLYPFGSVISKDDCTADDAIELIDIGGPSLVRAAAKNHAFTAVVTGPDQYDEAIAAMIRGGTTLAERRLFAAIAFERTAKYDAVIARWMAGHAGLVAGGAKPTLKESQSEEPPLPARFALGLERRMSLRYGENPHQSAAMYAPADTHFGLAGLKQLSGKELSYNNLLDLDAAVRIADLIQDPGAAVIKHTNPCGAASAATIDEALGAAMAADSISAFGSIVAVNRLFDEAAAECLLKPGMFIEVIAAPAFSAGAVAVLTTRPAWKASVRLVEVPPGDPWGPTAGLELRSVAGGMLAQRPDETPDDPTAWEVVTSKAPTKNLTQPLDFAFTMVRRLTSNAIAVCQGTSLVGAGVGQTSRVDAVRIALEKAGDRAQGGVLASDAFFPFPDSIELIKQAGIAAIIQPGGSKRDPEVIAAANEANLPMIFTSRRHFRH